MNDKILNINRFLNAYRRKTVYFKTHSGNAAEAVIGLSAIRLFERNGINYKFADWDSDLSGETVFFGGGGNLIKNSVHSAKFISKCHARVKELVLLPQTIDGNEELLSSLGSNVIVFCRERKSYEYIKTYSQIKSVFLTDDLAFDLDLNQNLIRQNSPNTIVRIAPSKTVLKALIKKQKTPNFFVRRIDVSKTLNAFREDGEIAGYDLPDGNIDLSFWCNQKVEMLSRSVVKESSARLISTINKFDVIRTDRLHIAIVAAKLDKRVDLFNNNYENNKNVFDYSIKGVFPKVTWKGSLNESAE